LQHESELAVQLINKLSETSIDAFMLVTLEVVKLVDAKRKEMEGIGNCDVRNVVSGATCSRSSMFTTTYTKL